MDVPLCTPRTVVSDSASAIFGHDARAPDGPYLRLQPWVAFERAIITCSSRIRYGTDTCTCENPCAFSGAARVLFGWKFGARTGGGRSAATSARTPQL